MKHKPRVCIVTPARPEDNNGNWHTAARWQRFLASLAEVDVVQHWPGHDGNDGADVLIALHAWRSAASIERFHAAHPERSLALVLTGTDLYRDLGQEAGARHALQCATHLVVLQQEAIGGLAPADRARARVIEQSATRVLRHDKARSSFDFVAVGHLRAVKDPLTLIAAARLLPAALFNGLPPRVLHIGAALDDELAEAARLAVAECPHYRWLGGQPVAATRRWIARARALVHMSRMEGGAHVVVEAIRSGVPVLATRIAGNVGLLGHDYDGTFAPGDARALAALMQRFAAEPAFAAHLAAQCAAREPRFTSAAEQNRVRALLADLLASRRQRPLPQSFPSRP
ncbi:MAG: Glycosyl transferase, group 1 [Burkholderiaceae bacterium]|jgi:putative glycosyltransferase (TIGR04348 family)|nr:MAG: Glycosyl transferase, group 1 [Burkholderiaceae bacterium]